MNLFSLIFVLFIVLVTFLLCAALYYRAKLIKLKQVNVAAKIISSENKKVIQKIMEVAKQQVHAEACSLYFVDDKTQELYLAVALGKKGPLVKDMRFKINESSISGWVATNRKSLNIRDVTRDKRFKDRPVIKGLGLKEKTFLTMPITNNGKLAAVLQLINKEGEGYFTRDDKEIMEILIDTHIAPDLEKVKAYNYMQELYMDSIQTIANAIDARDEYTQGHCTRVSEYSVMIGKKLGMEEEELNDLRCSAILHDVGQIGTSDSILNSTMKLTTEEFEQIKTHVITGARILKPISKTKPGIVYGAKYHHERYDGTGYVEGLSGESIPLFARIIAVSDTFDAMTSNRPYRKGLPEEVAVAELIKDSGTKYDKKIVDAFLECFKEHT